MAIFNRSALASGPISISPTFRKTSKNLFVVKPVYDPKNVSQEHDKFNLSPDDKIRELSWTDHTLSYSVWTSVRGASQPWYVSVKKPNGGEVRKSSRMIKQLMAILSENDPNHGKRNQKGFSFKISLESVLSQMLRSVKIRGAIASELVLDKRKQPLYIKLIDPSDIEWKEPKPHVYIPWQQVRDKSMSRVFNGSSTTTSLSSSDPENEKSLNKPTFFWVRLDPDLDVPHAYSPMLPALHSVYFRRIFLEDLQSVVKKTAWPRISVSIVEEVLRENMPPDVELMSDEEQRDWMDRQMDSVAEVLQHLQPGQAIVTADYVKIGVLESQGHALGTLNPEPLLKVLARELAQATKTFDSVLGGSDKVDPLQAFLEGQSLKGYQQVVEDAMSQILTTAFRVMGKNVVAEFKYTSFELRPKSELEPNRTMRIKNDMGLMALGVMTPDEFSISSSGTPLPDGIDLKEFYNNPDVAKSLFTITDPAEEIEPSDTDTPNSPAKGGAKPGDKRGDSDAAVKKGQKASNKKSGQIKSSKTGVSRTPRVR